MQQQYANYTDTHNTWTMTSMTPLISKDMTDPSNPVTTNTTMATSLVHPACIDLEALCHSIASYTDHPTHTDHCSDNSAPLMTILTKPMMMMQTMPIPMPCIPNPHNILHSAISSLQQPWTLPSIHHVDPKPDTAPKDPHMTPHHPAMHHKLEMASHPL